MWCSISFSFREFIQDDRVIVPSMRNLHPAGGGPSKVCDIWNYNGPHGSGDIRLYKCGDGPNGDAWEPQRFIAPATSWVYYLDELHDGAIMTTHSSVILLYRSLWIYPLGFNGAAISMAIGMCIAWKSSDIGHMRAVGICLTFLRTLVVLWRWTADLLMSNHHRGAWLRHKTPPEAEAMSCKDYRRLHELDAFPDTELQNSFKRETSSTQMRMFLYAVSQRMAKFFQSRAIDWCANCFKYATRTKRSSCAWM